MINQDVQLRVDRLMAGNSGVDDLDRIFLALREHTYGRQIILEIGNFIAHRKERNKGPVQMVAADVFTSVNVWSKEFRGLKPTLEDFIASTWANSRLLSDRQLRIGLGLTRGRVTKTLTAGLRKLESHEPLTKTEEQVILFIGQKFVWRPVFNDSELIKEFGDVLIRNGFLAKGQKAELTKIGHLLTLHCIASMHGTPVRISDDVTATLHAGVSISLGTLEVKLRISFLEGKKPILVPICLFLTSLNADEYCGSRLRNLPESNEIGGWGKPIEMKDGKLELL